MRARRLTGFLAISLVAALGGATATAVAHEPTVTEFSTGLTLNAGPFGIADGPSDRLWFTENSVGGLGSITADSGLIGELTGSRRDPRRCRARPRAREAP